MTNLVADSQVDRMERSNIQKGVEKCDDHGLTDQEYEQGWHFYGSDKVYHDCRSCGMRRAVVAYDWGWIDPELCNECLMGFNYNVFHDN